MAITQNPIIGATRQSAGGMVFSRSLDQNVIRAKPITYNDKNSDAQQAVRRRMTAVTGLAKADSKKALDALYPTRPTKQTKFSRLIQQLMAAVTVIAGVITTHFANVLTLGNGTLASYFTATSFEAGAGTILVTQSNVIPDIATNSNYRAFAFLFNVTKGTGYSATLTAPLTASGMCSFAVPYSWAESDDVEVYFGYTNIVTGNSSLAYRLGD